MNANELADEYVSVDDSSYFRKDDDWWWAELGNIFNNIPPNDKYDDQRSAGCAMQYIKSLETQIEALKYEKSSGVYDDVPVAWTNADCLAMVKEDGESNMWWIPDLAKDIPLYTHPAKTYEDAIEKCAQRAEAYAYMSENFTVLADELRAILRNAQEK